jgi:hypothetical protein
MRAWNEWTAEERALFTRFHRDTKLELLSMEELSILKSIVDIEMYCQPISKDMIDEANYIIDCFDAGILSRKAESSQ